MDVGTIISQVVFVGMGAAIFSGFYYAASRRERDIDLQWRDFAARRGLSYEAATGHWLARSSPRMHGHVGGVHVSIDSFVVRGAESASTFTRVSGTAAFPSPVSVKVERSTLLRTLGALIGMQDLVIGDPIFDERCVVRASDETLGRDLLDAPMRDALQRWIVPEPQRAEFSYERGAISVVWQGVELRHDALDAAVAVVLAAQGGRDRPQSARST